MTKQTKLPLMRVQIGRHKGKIVKLFDVDGHTTVNPRLAVIGIARFEGADVDPQRREVLIELTPDRSSYVAGTAH